LAGFTRILLAAFVLQGFPAAGRADHVLSAGARDAQPRFHGDVRVGMNLLTAAGPSAFSPGAGAGLGLSFGYGTLPIYLGFDVFASFGLDAGSRHTMLPSGRVIDATHRHSTFGLSGFLRLAPRFRWFRPYGELAAGARDAHLSWDGNAQSTGNGWSACRGVGAGLDLLDVFGPENQSVSLGMRRLYSHGVTLQRVFSDADGSAFVDYRAPSGLWLWSVSVVRLF